MKNVMITIRHMSDPYVSKARGRDQYTLYCYNVRCLDISNVPTEFNVMACVKLKNNTQKIQLRR